MAAQTMRFVIRTWYVPGTLWFNVCMFLGAHVSIAGGVEHAPQNAAALGCEVFQMFSRSPQGGPAPKLTDESKHVFLEYCKEHNQKEWVIHAPYYINFASSETRIRRNSARIIREELERGTVLHARYVMFHPGSAKDVGVSQAMRFVIDGIKDVLDRYKGTTELLIELSAGAGMVIGAAFEEVAELLEGVGHPDLHVCFDTAHAFASGYDLRTRDAIDETLTAFDATIGLKHLKISHCNDSKVGLGERRDRHEHLGEGYIGLEGFRAWVNHPRLASVNLYLETEPKGVAKDMAILKSLRNRGQVLK